LSPLVSAIAAGNTAIIKPSEFTPHSVVVMKKIIEEVFEKNEVALIEGGVDVATKLLSLPFNHIFFTGSPEVGKIVMSAAAKNLASVTLELGGKSPSIIDETADLKTIVPRLVWGKFANAGQICLAPDYVLVHESKKEELIAGLKKSITAYYGTDASASPDMARMINAANYKRVRSYIDEAVLEGANVVYGGRSIEEEKYIEPTIITDLDPNTNLMQKEIFGPVLPIIAYKDLNEAIALIRSKEKPLALYIYSRNKKNIKKILSETRAGGTCINHNDIHFFNPHLPFGGSNNSGIGKAHGWFGFSAFSNERGVYKQIIPGAIDLLKPPYNNFKQRLIDLTIKWF
jgi:aldehyde dehydrogenase (NAD+)